MSLKTFIDKRTVCPKFVTFAMSLKIFMFMEIKNFSNVIPAIQKKVGNRSCPACGKFAGFTIDNAEFQHVSFNRTNVGLRINGEHRYIPCVSVICKNCGYIMNFHLPTLLDDPEYLNL